MTYICLRGARVWETVVCGKVKDPPSIDSPWCQSGKWVWQWAKAPKITISGVSLAPPLLGMRYTFNKLPQYCHITRTIKHYNTVVTGSACSNSLFTLQIFLSHRNTSKHTILSEVIHETHHVMRIFFLPLHWRFSLCPRSLINFSWISGRNICICIAVKLCVYNKCTKEHEKCIAIFVPSK